MAENVNKNKLKSQSISLPSEFLLALSIGIASTFIFLRETDWLGNEISRPFLYFADPLYYANLVRNAQIGNPLLGESLGAPGGQQYSLSAYGFEWIQSAVVAFFASPEQGPWLAINRFAVFTYFLTGFCSYIALRLIGASRIFSSIGAVSFTLVPDHQPYSVGFANMGPLALVVSVLWLILAGRTLDNVVVKETLVRDATRRKVLNVLIVSLIVLFQLTSAVYYIILVFLLGASILVIFLIKRVKIDRIKVLLTFLSLQVATLAIVLLPIVLGRIFNGLPFAEQSTGDRRPFAAYANGGDFFSLISPYSANSLYYQFLSHFPTVREFYREYYSSPITLGSEYVLHPGGLTFLALGLLLVIMKNSKLPITKNGKDGAPKEDFFLSGVVFLILTFAWFIRGGLGTLLAFVFPYVRGYARFSPILMLLAIGIIAQIGTTSKITRVKVIAILCSFVILLDNASNLVTIGQKNSNYDVRTVGVGELGGASVLAEDISFRTLGYFGTKKLVQSSNNLLPEDCSVLVLPLVAFPVDFKIGITSYYTLELIKPGLENSKLKWSSGGLTGTPNNSFSDRWLPKYQNADYKDFIDSVRKSNFCGVLIMRGLQDAFAKAGELNGSNYGLSSEVTSLLNQSLGKPCYSDLQSAIDLYCIKPR